MKRIECPYKYIKSDIIDNQGKYISNGYKIYIRDNFFQVVYRQRTYRISIVKHAIDFYLHMESYKTGYFITKYYDISSFHLTLLAIKESDPAPEKNT